MRNRQLELIYFSESNCLHFTSEELQRLVVKTIDIDTIIHFSIMGLESTKFIAGDNFLSIADTFFDLIQETEDSLRFPGFSAELSNGIKLFGDLNLTYIKAENIKSLFEFSIFIFNAFNLDMSVLLDIPVILTPHSSHIDPPTRSWFLRTVKT